MFYLDRQIAFMLQKKLHEAFQVCTPPVFLFGQQEPNENTQILLFFLSRDKIRTHSTHPVNTKMSDSKRYCINWHKWFSTSDTVCKSITKHTDIGFSTTAYKLYIDIYNDFFFYLYSLHKTKILICEKQNNYFVDLYLQLFCTFHLLIWKQICFYVTYRFIHKLLVDLYF